MGAKYSIVADVLGGPGAVSLAYFLPVVAVAVMNADGQFSMPGLSPAGTASTYAPVPSPNTSCPDSGGSFSTDLFQLNAQ